MKLLVYIYLSLRNYTFNNTPYRQEYPQNEEGNRAQAEVHQVEEEGQEEAAVGLLITRLVFTVLASLE